MQISTRARGAVWFIMISLLFIAAYFDYIREVNPPLNPWILRVIGIIILILVFRASGVTGRYLRVYGDSVGGVPKKLVRVGPYSCMRHPMHFFLSLFPLSLSLLLAQRDAIIIGVIEMLVIQSMAVLLDEKEAQSRFGDEYLEYKRKTPPFNVNPACLIKSLKRKPPLKNNDAEENS